MSNSVLETPGTGSGTPVVVQPLVAGSVTITLNYSAPTLPAQVSASGSGLAWVIYQQLSTVQPPAPLPAYPTIGQPTTVSDPSITNTPYPNPPYTPAPFPSAGMFANGLYDLTNPPAQPAGYGAPSYVQTSNPNEPQVLNDYTWAQNMVNNNYSIMAGWAYQANMLATAIVSYFHATAGYP